MIALPHDYSTASAYDGSMGQRLAPGGYVCRIIGARSETVNTRSGAKEKFVLAYDIAEGEFAGYYDAQYKRAKEQDAGKAKWRGTYDTFILTNEGATNPFFKGLLTCIDKSNEPFTCVVNGQLNEASLKGKLVGLLMREEEYIGSDGRKHTATRACAARSVQTIREGGFEVPEPKLLQGNGGRNASASVPAGYTQVEDDDLPF